MAARVADDWAVAVRTAAQEALVAVGIHAQQSSFDHRRDHPALGDRGGAPAPGITIV